MKYFEQSEKDWVFIRGTKKTQRNPKEPKGTPQIQFRLTEGIKSRGGVNKHQIGLGWCELV